MKKLTTTFLFILCPLLFSANLWGESAMEITETHYRALLEDLQAYMLNQPSADDVNAARSIAIEAAHFINDPVMVELLSEQFEILQKTTPLPEEDLLNTGMLLARFSQQFGQYDKAEYIVTQFSELGKSTGNPNFNQVAAMIDTQLKMPRVGDSPSLKGIALDGKEINLEDYKGKIVLLDFWATWCPPCVEEAPRLVNLYSKYKEKGFEIIGISADRSKIPLEMFIGLNKITWPNLFDDEQESSIGDQFSVTQYPTTFLLDREGKVMAVNLYDESLKTKLAELFE